MNLKSFRFMMVVVLLMLLGMSPTARSDVLSAKGNQLWSQNSPGIKDDAEEGDFFGYALASGDFDNNGRADLAIGVLGEDIGNILDAGAVNILYEPSPPPLPPMQLEKKPWWERLKDKFKLR